MSERYVVKLASGAWLTDIGTQTRTLREALKLSRAEAYRLAASWSASDAVALRLRPSARAAELAKLRAEVEELEGKLDAMTDNLHAVTAEHDALAAQLAALPPDVTDEELELALEKARTYLDAAKDARRLLRGPVAPARPVEELRDELEQVYDSLPAYLPGHKVRTDWTAVAKRARELGAR